MIVSEKDPRRTDITEALIELYRSSNAQVRTSCLPALPKEWEERATGKRVVLYCVGRDSFKGMELLPAIQRLQGQIYHLVKLFCHVQGFLLWWYDDGFVSELIKLGEGAEQQKLEEAYTEAIRYCHQNACALHDDSGDMGRAVAWAEACYGDESPLIRMCLQADKPIFYQTFGDDRVELEKLLSQICVVKQSGKGQLPTEWEHTAVGKKVILFRLPAHTLLEEEERTAILIDCLLCWLETREDVCLWWLVDDSVKALLPMLHENVRSQIENVIGMFCDNEYTIYDETGDAGRALSYADVCYGDGWHEIGIFQNVRQKLLKPEYERLKYMPACPDVRGMWQEGNKIWFIYNEREVFGALCEADLETDQVKIICDVPNDESHVGWGLDYYVFGKTGTKFIMAPYFSGEAFYEYDTATGQSRLVACEEEVWRPNKERYSAFVSRASWQGDLFFLGDGNGLIVQYCAKDGKYIYHREWASSLEKIVQREKIVFTNAVQRGSFWHMALQSEPLWVTVNLADMTVQMREIPLEKNFVPAGVMDDGQSFWMTPQKGNTVVCWQPISGRLKSYVCSSVSAVQKYPFSGIADWQGKN